MIEAGSGSTAARGPARADSGRRPGDAESTPTFCPPHLVDSGIACVTWADVGTPAAPAVLCTPCSPARAQRRGGRSTQLCTTAVDDALASSGRRVLRSLFRL